MSRQNKMASKRKHRIKHAALNTATHKAEKTGNRGGRTKKLHNKVQQYPKTVLLGPGRWKWAD
jgi:hypothetical protein